MQQWKEQPRERGKGGEGAFCARGPFSHGTLPHTHTHSLLPPCRPPDPSSSLFVLRLILDRVNECRFSGKKFPRKYRDDVAQSRLDRCTRTECASASIKYVSSDARGGRLQQVGPCMSHGLNLSVSSHLLHVSLERMRYFQRGPQLFLPYFLHGSRSAIEIRRRSRSHPSPPPSIVATTTVSRTRT